MQLSTEKGLTLSVFEQIFTRAQLAHQFFHLINCNMEDDFFAKNQNDG
jgi:hypothetical protein